MKGGSNLKVYMFFENMIFFKDNIGRNLLKFCGCRILYNFLVGIWSILIFLFVVYCLGLYICYI